MKFSSEARKLDGLRRIGSVFAAIALILTLPASAWADDIEFSEAAIGDDALAETHGVGQDASLLFQGETPTGDGATQSVSIGALSEETKFGSYNAVAIAIIRQDAVQIIGNHDVADITGN